MMTVGEQTDPRVNPNYKGRRNCACNHCKDMRCIGCKNPHKCGEYARDYIQKLGRKWNPRYNESNRGFMDEEQELIQETEGVVFNPDITLRRSLTGGF